jgi:hypothetical protein
MSPSAASGPVSAQPSDFANGIWPFAREKSRRAESAALPLKTLPELSLETTLSHVARRDEFRWGTGNAQ